MRNIPNRVYVVTLIEITDGEIRIKASSTATRRAGAGPPPSPLLVGAGGLSLNRGIATTPRNFRAGESVVRTGGENQ